LPHQPECWNINHPDEAVGKGGLIQGKPLKVRAASMRTMVSRITQ